MGRWLAQYREVALTEGPRCVPLTTEVSETVPETGIPAAPDPPLQLGWLVTWRDQSGRLRGGALDRQAGTVTACHWSGRRWQVEVPNGSRFGLARVVGVAQTDDAGSVVAAWLIRSHGYDGDNREQLGRSEPENSEA